MNIDSNTVKTYLSMSTNSALMLNAACQGIIETYIQPSKSQWYSQLKDEISDAQSIVKEWRTQGYLYFDQDILAETISCGQTFTESKDKIIGYFETLKKNPLDGIKTDLVAALEELCLPIQKMICSITNYERSLKNWEDKMQQIHDQLGLTIQSIQNQESELQVEIKATNDNIEQLNKQIYMDRQAIIKAKESERAGESETILGIIFAPFTGGITLILAGIGVASICEAEGQIADMQATIRTFQSKITGLQQKLTADQAQVASLQGVTLTTNIVLSDVDTISTSTDTLKTYWMSFEDALKSTVGKVAKAEKLDDIVVCEAWYEAVCNEFEEISPHSRSLHNINV